MDFPGGNILAAMPQAKIYIAGAAVVLFVGVCLTSHKSKPEKTADNPSLLKSLWLFAYSCFLKPHSGDAKRNQQDALESFYKGQAGAYDTTRSALLKGREHMLALAAAQLKVRAQESGLGFKRRVWVDVSRVLNSTYTINAMAECVCSPRLEAGPVSTSRRWHSLWMCLPFSIVSTL